MSAAVALSASAGVALAAGFAAAALRPRTLTCWLLAAYLIASAEVVIALELLSPFRAVSAPSLAGVVAVAVASAAGVWWRVGRPRLPKPAALDLRGGARRNAPLAALAVVVAAALVYELVLLFTTPPNNGDSLTYHLTRAAAWLQEGGLHRIPGPEKAAENVYPPNAELQILFTFVFLHADRAAALPQFIAQATLIVAVYGCARRIGSDRAGAMFAALLLPTLSVVALQSTTTQNDLVVAAYVACAAYFVQSPRLGDLALAGLAVGLALGTKFTAVFALPALALLAAATLPRRRVLAAAAAACLGWAVVGSYAYGRNLLEDGSPLGHLEGEIGGNRPTITLPGTVSTLVRQAYRFVDVSGYPVDSITYLRPIAGAARRLFDVLRIPENPPESTSFPFSFAINAHAHEDIAFFGPLGILVILPLALVVPIAAARGRASRAAAVHALALPMYLLASALGYKYSAQGRFLISAVALALPVAALIYRHTRLAAAVATIGVATLVFAHVSNEMKPTGLRGGPSIWELPRSKARARGFPVEIWYALERIDARVPPDARLGTVVFAHDPDYLLYGPRLARRPIPVSAAAPLSAAERRGIRWVYIGPYARPPTARVGWRAERLSDAGTLLERVDSRNASQ